MTAKDTEEGVAGDCGTDGETLGSKKEWYAG
jgi:hypothetical protein